MDIKEAKKVKQLVVEYDDMTREYNKAFVGLKNIPANGGRVIIEPDIGVFELNSSELERLLKYIKDEREFRLQVIKDELSKYCKCENISRNYEDDLK